MSQLEGATSDPSRIGSVRSVLSDYTVTTPQKMQELAARYLGQDNSWRLEVVPENAKANVATR